MQVCDAACKRPQRDFESTGTARLGHVPEVFAPRTCHRLMLLRMQQILLLISYASVEQNDSGTSQPRKPLKALRAFAPPSLNRTDDVLSLCSEFFLSQTPLEHFGLCQARRVYVNRL